VETTTTANRFQTIEILTLNDVHGLSYIDSTNFANGMSIWSKMGKYVENQRALGKNIVTIANGDMLQGSALSNYYYGLPIIESLNAMQFDAFVLGNHEFDWGIDKIANYKDGNEENGEAVYPFLAANIVDKVTLEPMPWTVPYVIKEMNGVKVAILGLIGDVYTSIAPSRVADYVFLDVVDQASYWTHRLRTVEQVDIVIVSIHGYNSSENSEIASFQGDYRVDAIVNGHTHSNFSQTISRTGAPLPYVQTSASSQNLMGKIVLQYDTVEKVVTSAGASLLSSLSFGNVESAEVRQILDVFSGDSVFQAFIQEELTNVTAYAGTSTLAVWGASVIRDYMGVDVGVLNSGGFRKALPAGPLTMGFLVEVYPFDNYIKTVEMTGAMLIQLKNSSSLIFDDRFDVNSIDPQATYTVAAVDYVFDQDRYNFLQGENIVQTSILMRDLLVNDLRNSQGSFDPQNGTSFPS
jgi:2',3'-cyclic-nucleotide 2'-phosphodiesterase (5'-nucleotidase family)